MIKPRVFLAVITAVLGGMAGCSPGLIGEAQGGGGGSDSVASSGPGGASVGASSSSSTGAGGAGGMGGGSASSSSSSGGPPPTVPWEGKIDPNGGPAAERLVAHPLGTTTAPQGFYEYVPAGYPSGVKWPLLVALHGIGENGNGTTELSNILATGIHAMLNGSNWPNDRPFVILMPQHPGGGCPGADEVQSFLAWAIQNYEIDPRYVYLTGLSCGAIGSWTYLGKYVDSQIAAFVSVAGDGKGAWAAQGCNLGKVAIWALHGDADDVVDVSGTNIPMDGLIACPHPPALESIKTIYPGAGHNTWSMTYDGSAGHDVFTWLLGFRKP